tara:strand:+ start:6598 stop:7275 length:678 start_codon:yes stop_codon:yes gene_type:complete
MEILQTGPRNALATDYKLWLDYRPVKYLLRGAVGGDHDHHQLQAGATIITICHGALYTVTTLFDRIYDSVEEQHLKSLWVQSEPWREADIEHLLTPSNRALLDAIEKRARGLSGCKGHDPGGFVFPARGVAAIFAEKYAGEYCYTWETPHRGQWYRKTNNRLSPVHSSHIIELLREAAGPSLSIAPASEEDLGDLERAEHCAQRELRLMRFDGGMLPHSVSGARQ